MVCVPDLPSSQLSGYHYSSQHWGIPQEAVFVSLRRVRAPHPETLHHRVLATAGTPLADGEAVATRLVERDAQSL
ncbi:hypothetical protein RRG08_002938 [Elysia crispata]|uniref:Uncharacterized protein n=1 Tax=Elysia crispata TaxID=231223 RepID=A0AAE1APN4_9GAST|nr:hypothetical protein RRG08_002938 [Elysia crispata]